VWTGKSHSDEIIGRSLKHPSWLTLVVVMVSVKMVIRVFTLNIVAQTGKIQRSSSNEHELMTGGTAA